MNLEEEIKNLDNYIRKAEQHGTTNKHYEERVQLRKWLIELKEIKDGGKNEQIN